MFYELRSTNVKHTCSLAARVLKGAKGIATLPIACPEPVEGVREAKIE